MAKKTKDGLVYTRMYDTKDRIHSRRGIASTVLGFISMLLLIALVSWTMITKDTADWIGAVGFTSFAIAFIGMVEGLTSFRDDCRSYIFSRIGSVYCGIMVAGWFLLFCLGLSR